MPALGLYGPPSLARVLFLPLACDVVVGLDFEKAFEKQRKALRGRLLQSQNLEVVVVKSQMSPVAFQHGLREVVVEEGVVIEPRRRDLFWGEIEDPLENGIGLLLLEQAGRLKVAD